MVLRMMQASACCIVLSLIMMPSLLSADATLAVPPSDGSADSPLKYEKIVVENYPEDGVTLGQGWDSYLGRKTQGICVTGSVYKLDGETTELAFKRIDDTEQLFNSLHISASARYSGGVSSVSGSASFAHDVQIDTNSINVLASIDADKGGTFLGPVDKSSVVANGPTTTKYGQLQFEQEALDSMKPKDGASPSFRSKCGDAFVVGIRVGGSFHTVFNLKTYSKDDKQTMSASISANGPNFSANSSIEKKINDKQTHNQIEIKMQQIGGNASKMPQSIDDITAQISGFANDDGFRPRPYEIYLLDYRNLAGYIDDGLTKPENLEKWADLQIRMMNLHRQYLKTIINPDGYAFVSFGRDLVPATSTTPQIPAVDALTDVMQTDGNILTSAQFLDLVLSQCALNRQCKLTTALAQTITQMEQDVEHGKVTPSSQLFLTDKTTLERSIRSTVGLQPLQDAAAIYPDGKLLGLLSSEGMTQIQEAQKAQDNQASVQSVAGTTDQATDVSASFGNIVAAARKMNGLGESPAGTVVPGKSDALPIKSYFGQQGFAWYYQWIAMMPVNMGEQEDKSHSIPAIAPEVDLGDFVSKDDAAKYDKELADKVANPGTALKDSFSKQYRVWNFENRLLPLSSQFCSVSSLHPMCVSPGFLSDMAANLPIGLSAAEIRSFYHVPTSPAAPPPHHVPDFGWKGNCPGRIYNNDCL